MLKRAYSVLEIKAVSEDQRMINGIASTPTPDRMDDVVQVDGIEFKLPLPLLYQHNSRQPIGNVTQAKVVGKELQISAQLAPPGTAQFIDEAWSLIKTGLIRGLSIGFRSLEETYDRERGGFNFIRTELMEISAVTIPANQDANITAVKSADQSMRAASGSEHDGSAASGKTHKPGAPGQPSQGRHMKKTIREQITDFENKRAASVARMTEIMEKASDEASRTLDATETEEYDTLQDEVKSIDAHIVRLKAHEQQMIAKATAVTKENTADPEKAAQTRSGVVTVQSNLPKGTGFTRYAIALARAKGNLVQAHAIAESAWKDTPEVAQVLKAAVEAGTTTDAGWAGSLVNYQVLASEFIEFLRPLTIIGKIPGLRRVPFNVKLPLQDAGSSAQWVGQGARKPVSSLHFDTATLKWAKAAGIVVLTEELVRFSNPSAEALVRQDMAAAVAQFLDEQFVDPNVTEQMDVSPASITNGAGNDTAGGVDADDLRADFKNKIFAQFDGANIPTDGCVWIMKPGQATALSLMLNPLGQPEFPNINANGGTLLGYAVITSNSVPSGDVIFCKPSEILLADDGTVTLDASNQASLVMDDGGSPANTEMVSLWQNNLIALRAERFINWKRRRDDAVFTLTSCNYGG